MICACMGGHGPGCHYYAPYCTGCGERIAGKVDLHDCPQPRYCGGCGVQVFGPGVRPFEHHICQPQQHGENVGPYGSDFDPWKGR